MYLAILFRVRVTLFRAHTAFVCLARFQDAGFQSCIGGDSDGLLTSSDSNVALNAVQASAVHFRSGRGAINMRK